MYLFLIKTQLNNFKTKQKHKCLLCNIYYQIKLFNKLKFNFLRMLNKVKN